MPKAEKNTEPENEQNTNSTLVGFVRKSNAGRAVKYRLTQVLSKIVPHM